MNRFKKAISVGMSAALLASLFTVIAASTALATTSVTSAGVVPVGGTSATPASFQFCENSAGSWAAPGGTITVTITPAAPGAGAVNFTNADGDAPSPTFSQNPGGLGATAVAGGNLLTVTVPHDDGVNVLCFTVGNLWISAAAGTSTGAIKATAGGTLAVSTYTPATVNAAGTLQTSQPSSATDFLVNTTSACPFVDVGSGAGPAGHFIIAGVNAGATGTATALVAGQQTLTVPALGTATTAGQAVTQADVPNCAGATLGSPGTVGNAVTQTAVTGSAVPGEQNQATGNTTITETAAGYLAANTVLTFTISAPATGVTFSHSEWADPSAQIDLGSGLGVPVLCVLQIGQTACTVKVKTASTTLASSITLFGTSTGGGIAIDMASSVAPGTKVKIAVTGSPAILVVVSSNTIANAARVIVGVASQPVIYINYNAQATGMISLTEQGPGFFTSSGVNDAFGLCITTGESFTFAPYAIVASGDLMLLTSTSTGATTVQGTLYNVGSWSCARWSIYSKSTVASVIDIVGATATGPLAIGPGNGPTLSVPAGLQPGTTQAWILVGKQADVAAANGTAQSSLVSFATRAFKSDVVVAAVSQPTITKGTVGAAAGDITITETLNGQFKPGQLICLQIQPRATNNFIQDTWYDIGGGVSTNKLPIITTNAASGLLVSPVTIGGTNENNCSGGLSDNRAMASFTVTQQSFGGTLGVITISNIHYVVSADAVDGNVQVRVFTKCCQNAGVQFSTFISNARIGSAQVDAWIAAGNNTRAASAFGLNTVITAQGSRVTVRSRGASAPAGTLVQIWVKTRTTAWHLETNRRITSDGYAYYSPRVLNHGYRYYRVAIFGNISNTVRAFGR